MTDPVAMQAKLEAATQRIAELESVILRWEIGKASAGASSDLDDVQCSGNTPDMPHEPCEKVTQATETAQDALMSSHRVALRTATINGKLNVLIGLHLTLLGALAWIFLRVDSHEIRITQCCIDAHRLEVFEARLSETVAHLRSAQPSTVAKVP